MFGKVGLLEVRYWKQSDVTYLLRQFNDRFKDSSSRDSVCELEQNNTSVCLPVCMSVCESLSVCLSVCLSQTHIALGLKHNLFRQRRPQVKTKKHHKENMRW